MAEAVLVTCAMEMLKNLCSVLAGEISLASVDTIKETLGGKKYLLVLDDMWNKKVDAWERLKSHLIFGAQGSKIIVTTRSDEVASVIRGMIPPYNLKKLSEDECWLIIKQRAFASGGAAAETPNVTSNKIGDISKVRRLRLIFDEDVLIYPKSLEDASKLRTLFGTQEGDSDIDYQKFLSNKQYLRVLDLQWSSIKNLPPSIEMMKHLRYLDLSKTNIEELPEFITSLYNLQTLLLRYCDKLETFPKDMGTLKLLRYLDLSGSCFEVLPESITSLCILRTLKLEDCSNLKELPKDINKLINLRHLILSNHGIWDEMPREMGRLSHLQTLRQFKVGKYNRGATIRELEGLNLLEGELWISNLQNVTNPMDAQGANLNAKRKIRSLMLEWRNATPSPSQPSRWLKSVASSSSSFPCLEKMIVEKCPKLEAKQDLSFIEYFFPSIKDYELDGTKLIRLDAIQDFGNPTVPPIRVHQDHP
ncbi:Leucine-rich repeat [Macleaya cordata]|uniref:Leucine-rich repeat n=1 Tax=Macleaya cordata TaxID=56857 RepID=A0A200QB07_MACCD|nr:Leucine-rich repeat [Macleaya cordata]